MVRAGRQGEHETRFFSENRVYMTWRETKDDLHPIRDKRALRELLTGLYPGATTAKISNHTGQIGAFLFGMQRNDLVVVLRKGNNLLDSPASPA